MPGFRYRATGSDGKPLRGVIEGRDLDDARLRLEGRGWQNVHVTAAVLPKPRPDLGPTAVPSRVPIVLLILLILLLAALFALVWFDPFAWRLLETYGLRPDTAA